jgi:2-methylaconitate cis-trans-isomerase PrpF
MEVRGDQLAIPAVFMRGGTSRGLIIRRDALPNDSAERERILCSIYGSPDRRQIDGIGGATGPTSKVCIVAPSSRPDADIEYTFGQVRIDEVRVDFDGNCGNMASGVAAYAVDEGFVEIPGDGSDATVRIYFTNTDQVVDARVPVIGGVARADGAQRLEGVPVTGAPIFMDFWRTAGTLGRGPLPMGEVESTVSVGGASYRVSVVDVGNAAVFVRAEDVGMTGTELPAQISQQKLDLLVAIRGEIAYRLGRSSSPARAQAETPATPKVYVVAPPREYLTLDGRTITAEEITVLSRGLIMGRPHEAHAATVAVCVAVASRIPGTVVNEVAGPTGVDGVIEIGHPSGVTAVAAKVAVDGAQVAVESASLVLTARRLMSGYAFARASTAGLRP